MKKKARRRQTSKRPTDVNQAAHLLVQRSTQDVPDSTEPTKSEISRVMAELGRRGGKAGGKRRAEVLTKERRSEIALNAARKRWDNTTQS